MSDRDLAARVEELERRLAALEAGAQRASEAVSALPPAQHVSVPGPAPTPDLPPVIAHGAAPSPVPAAAPVPAPPTVPLPPAAPVAAPAPVRDPQRLERFIGLKVAAWAGGFIVIGGIALFARYAISEGWFSGLTPEGKLALSYAAAVVLGVAGLALRRQLGRLPSAALLAAGLGGCYVATCAGVRPFDVLDPVAALVVSALIACGGAWVTIRARQPAAAAISLVGAYLVPVFTLPGALDFSVAAGAATFTAGYYTAIYAVVLASARLGPSSFARLRALGWFQAGVAALMVAQLRNDAPLTTSICLALWWAMAVAECVLAALAGRSPRANVAYVVGATVIATPFAVIGALSPNPWGSPYSWVPAALGLACAVGAVVAGAPVPPQRTDDADRRDDPRGSAVADACRALAAVLAALVAVEAVVQVGVLVRGGALPVSWAAMGAVAAIASRRLGNRLLAWAGLLAMLPAFVVAFVFLVFGSATAGVLFEWGTRAAEWGTGSMTSWYVRVTDATWAPAIVCVILALTARWWNRAEDVAAAGGPRDALASRGAVIPALGAAFLWCALALYAADGYASMSLALLGGLAAAAFGTGGHLARAVGFAFVLVVGMVWYIALAATMVEPRLAGPVAGALPVPAVSLAVLALLAARAPAPAAAATTLGLAVAHAMASAALLVLAWSLVGRTQGSGADVQSPLEWGALVLAVLGSVPALTCHGDRWAVARDVGRVGVAVAAFVAVLASIGRASAPVEGHAWIDHWFANAGTPASIVSLVALVVVRGERRAPAAVMMALALVGAVLVGASCVSRFLDPGAAPPFHVSGAMQRAAVSAWLGLAGLSLVIVGFRASSGAVRWIGLVTLALTAGKVLLHDMSDAEPAWRVAAMVATGILIVASSAVYARAARQPGAGR